MQLTLRSIFACVGLVLATVLTACSSGGEQAHASDERQTTDSAGGESAAVDEADGEATPSADESVDEQVTSDEPESEDEPESVGEPAATGSMTIGGAATGLTLEIPDEWVELAMDADTASEEVEGLDLTDDQAALVEWWMGVFPNSDGVAMAVDLSTMTASAVTNVNAHCAPNDGRIGRQPGVTPTPLQNNDLEEWVELAIWDTFGHAAVVDMEVESTTVDGYPAARGTYKLDMARTVVDPIVATAAGVGVQYMLLTDDDVCWVTFTGPDESSFDLFDGIAATIDVL